MPCWKVYAEGSMYAGPREPKRDCPDTRVQYPRGLRNQIIRAAMSGLLGDVASALYSSRSMPRIDLDRHVKYDLAAELGPQSTYPARSLHPR